MDTNAKRDGALEALHRVLVRAAAHIAELRSTATLDVLGRIREMDGKRMVLVPRPGGATEWIETTPALEHLEQARHRTDKDRLRAAASAVAMLACDLKRAATDLGRTTGRRALELRELANRFIDAARPAPTLSRGWSTSAPRSLGTMLGNCARVLAELPPENEARTKSGPTVRPTWAEKGLPILQQHPEWSDRQIAAEVGCKPSAFSRSPRWKSWRAAFKNTGAVPEGTEAAERTLEAWRQADDKDATP